MDSFGITSTRCHNYATFLLLIASMTSLHLVNTKSTTGSRLVETFGLHPTLAPLAWIEFPTINATACSSSHHEDNGNGATGCTKAEDDEVGKPTQFINNGVPATQGEFKFHAVILVETPQGLFYLCGGVLISSHIVITAAHCLAYATGNVTYNYYVAAGIYDLSLGMANPGAQLSNVTYYSVHPEWGPREGGFPNDLAVLYLYDSIETSEHVEYAKIANKSQSSEFEGDKCVVTGFGITENGTNANVLMTADQYITTLQNCRDFWAITIDQGVRITKRQMCGAILGSSACRGDTGGPLTCGDTVVGLVSWGLKECSGCFPTVYTKLSFYDDWLRTKIVP